MDIVFFVKPRRLLPTIFTLVWSNFNMADTKTLKDFGDGSLIQLWANVLFTLHIGVSMIVLLNMLIAMMNNSYEKITVRVYSIFLL